MGVCPSGSSWIGTKLVPLIRAASRGQGSYLPKHAGRSVFLVILTLAVPVLVAANPVDPTWQPGIYDDGDTDQLVVQTLSPEGMIGLAALMLACFLLHPTLIEPSVPCRRRVSAEWADARGPPRRSRKSANQSVAPCPIRARVPLLVFGPSLPSQAFPSLGSATPDPVPAAGEVLPHGFPVGANSRQGLSGPSVSVNKRLFEDIPGSLASHGVWT